MRTSLFKPVIALIALTVLGTTAGCATSDQATPVRFSGPRTGAAMQTAPTSKNSLVQMPTHPISFQETSKVGGAGGNTPIALTTYHGKKSGFTGKVWVWAPPEYYEKKNANKGFPVMEALPGAYGYPVNYWIGADLKLEESLATWSKEGKSLPFIVVMPVLNPNDKQYYDGSDIPGQPKIGTWLSKDVPDLVRENFRTLKTRNAWCIMGSSSGGFSALKNVLQNPKDFKVAIPNGPDIVPDSPLWRGHLSAMRANNPEVLAHQLIARGGPDVYLAFQDGSKENTVLPKVRKFIAQYGRGPVKTRLQVVPDGTHSGATYVQGLGMGTMQWVSAHMQGPTG